MTRCAFFGPGDLFRILHVGQHRPCWKTGGTLVGGTVDGNDQNHQNHGEVGFGSVGDGGVQ